MANNVSLYIPNVIDLKQGPSEQYIHYLNVENDTDLYFVQIGHQITSPAYYYGPVVRDHYLIHFVKSGKGRFETHGRSYDIEPGKCFLIEPDQLAYYISDDSEPWEYYWIGFGGYSASAYIERMGFTGGTYIMEYTDQNRIIEQFEHVEAMGYREQNYLAYCGTLYYMLYYMTQQGALRASDERASVKKKKVRSEMIDDTMTLIQNSYASPLIVEAIARSFSISPAHLCRIFKAQTGMSIKEYIIRQRLRSAIKLMRKPDMAISQIAAMVGIPDPYYFSRLFKSRYNISPSQYRRDKYQK